MATRRCALPIQHAVNQPPGPPAGCSRMAPAETPLPWRPMLGILVLNSTPPFQINMIFPFLPWMVDDLRGTAELSGFYVGLMASVYMAGQTLAALVFPQLSDTMIGRKKSIIVGHFALIVPMLMFGLSRTYWEAFMWRFLNGALQCNRPITNAVIAEITDETNQAKAYGLGAMSWGTATMLGPSLGGLLAFPATLYPTLFAATGAWGSIAPESLASMWATFPYLLPCAVAVVWALLGLIATIVCVPDDRPAVSWCALLSGRVDRDDPDSWVASAGDGNGGRRTEEDEEGESLLGGGDGATAKRTPPSPRATTKMSYCAMLRDRELGPAIQVYMWCACIGLHSFIY